MHVSCFVLTWVQYSQYTTVLYCPVRYYTGVRVEYCTVLCCLVLSCLVLFGGVLSCPCLVLVLSLSCIVLSCLVLSYLVLSCLVCYDTISEEYGVFSQQRGVLCFRVCHFPSFYMPPNPPSPHRSGLTGIMQHPFIHLSARVCRVCLFVLPYLGSGLSRVKSWLSLGPMVRARVPC